MNYSHQVVLKTRWQDVSNPSSEAILALRNSIGSTYKCPEMPWKSMNIALEYSATLSPAIPMYSLWKSALQIIITILLRSTSSWILSTKKSTIVTNSSSTKTVECKILRCFYSQIQQHHQINILLQAKQILVWSAAQKVKICKHHLKVVVLSCPKSLPSKNHSLASKNAWTIPLLKVIEEMLMMAWRYPFRLPAKEKKKQC